MAALQLLAEVRVDLVFILALLALYAATHWLILGLARLEGLK